MTLKLSELHVIFDKVHNLNDKQLNEKKMNKFKEKREKYTVHILYESVHVNIWYF